MSGLILSVAIIVGALLLSWVEKNNPKLMKKIRRVSTLLLFFGSGYAFFKAGASVEMGYLIANLAVGTLVGAIATWSCYNTGVKRAIGRPIIDSDDREKLLDGVWAVAICEPQYDGLAIIKNDKGTLFVIHCGHDDPDESGRWIFVKGKENGRIVGQVKN